VLFNNLCLNKYINEYTSKRENWSKFHYFCSKMKWRFSDRRERLGSWFQVDLSLFNCNVYEATNREMIVHDEFKRTMKNLLQLSI
jgi:hypothetical protein